jgi:hypothetical protein
VNIKLIEFQPTGITVKMRKLWQGITIFMEVTVIEWNSNKIMFMTLQEYILFNGWFSRDCVRVGIGNMLFAVAILTCSFNHRHPQM